MEDYRTAAFGISLKDLKVGHLYLDRVSGRPVMVLDDRGKVMMNNKVTGRNERTNVVDRQLIDLPPPQEAPKDPLIRPIARPELVK